MAGAMEALTCSDTDDGDSGYDEEMLSTRSITSSIYEHERENGRSYHAFHAGKYVMPNDEGEQERMDIHYHSLRLAFNNKLWLAPIENPSAVLDVGTGTGVWAMDCADDYPGAEVIGVDLSPIQPLHVPPNLQFEIFDLEESWEMPERFDIVHTRLMNGFSVKSWPDFYKQAFLALKAGGWVENQEFDLDFSSDDGTIPADSKVKEWEALWIQGVESMGATGRCYPYVMEQQMKDAGFINVTVKEFKMPLGPWPKDKRLREAGLYNLVGMSEGLTGLSIRVFTQVLGWSVEQMEILLMQVRAEWQKRAIHSYFPIWVVYGQKPPTTTSTR